MKYTPIFFPFIFLISATFFITIHSTNSDAADSATQYNFNSASSYSITSFRKAKKYLLATYKDNKKTFYCGCDFSNKKKINANNCGYVARKNKKRGSRLEWEHVVPASRFGKPLTCWKQAASFDRCIKKNGKKLSGRKCCRRVNEKFRTMEADMMNLVPSVGELNGDRSNYKFGIISGEKRTYGACDFEINTKRRMVEPNPSVRGNIARIYLYMHNKYDMELTSSEITLFNLWNNSDPIDDWEKQKHQRINTLLLTLETKEFNKQQFASD